MDAIHTRKLEVSDFAVQQEIEIKINPFKFLGLSEDASLKDVRGQYIAQVRVHHPNLISTDDNKRLEAHEQMVIINRAYTEIKARFNPKEWNSLSGYDAQTVYNEREAHYNKLIHLEGHGEITIYPNHYDYFVAGPYLDFDWGPDRKYLSSEYRHQISLKHLYAHMEIEEGKPVNRILLEPFIECFRLNEAESETLVNLLSDGKFSDTIMKELDIPSPWKDPDDFNYSLSFERQLNDIKILQPDWPLYDMILLKEEDIVELSFKDSNLILTEYGESIFTEPDQILFVTLAYGPLLTTGS